MFRSVFIYAIFMLNSFSESCVRYTFEENFYEDFSNELGICVGHPIWITGNYSDVDVSGHNEQSSAFISPQPGLNSCVSTSYLTMASGGTIEVLIYIRAPISSNNYILVVAHQVIINGDDPVAGNAQISSSDPNFASGWHTLKFYVYGPHFFRGHISFMGIAAEDAVVLIDSFRYIPPGIDESDCRIYEEEDPTTTELVTQTSTTPEIATETPTTPEIETETPTTPEIATQTPNTSEIPTTPKIETETPTTPEVETETPNIPELETETPTTPEIPTQTPNTSETPTSPELETGTPTTPEIEIQTPTTPEITTQTPNTAETPTTPEITTQTPNTAETPTTPETPNTSESASTSDDEDTDDKKEFWTPLTIAIIAVLVSLILLAIICLICCKCRNRHATPSKVNIIKIY